MIAFSDVAAGVCNRYFYQLVCDISLLYLPSTCCKIIIGLSGIAFKQRKNTSCLSVSLFYLLSKDGVANNRLAKFYCNINTTM